MHRVVIPAMVSLLLALPLHAQGCLGTGSADVRALLDAEQWESAQQLATQHASEHPDDLEARLDVARVHLAQVAQSSVRIDFAKLGFAVDASGNPLPGSKQIDTADITDAMKEDVVLDPKHADAAKVALQEVTSRWPKHLPAQLCLFDLLRRQPDHRGLLEAVGRAASSFADQPSAVDDLVRPALGYMNDDRPDLAADVYSKLLEAFPKSGSLLSDLASAKMALGHVREGQALLERAIGLAPDDWMIAANLATGARLLGDLDASQKWFERWHALQPEKTQVLFDLAMLAMRNGPKASLPAWDKYFEANKTHPDDEPWPSNAKAIRDGVASGSDNENFRDLAHQIASSGGDEVQALPLIAWLAAQYPDQAWPRYLRAQVLEADGRHELVVEELLAVDAMFKGATNGDIDRVAVWWNLSRNLVAAGNHAEALRWLGKIEGSKRDHPNLQYLLGNVNARLGNNESARKYWEACTALPNNAEFANQCRANLANLKPIESARRG